MCIGSYWWCLWGSEASWALPAVALLLARSGRAGVAASAAGASVAAAEGERGCECRSLAARCLLRGGGITGGFCHPWMPLLGGWRGWSGRLMLGGRRVLQVSLGLDYSSGTAVAFFLKTLCAARRCSVALELDQRKPRERNFRFPTFYLYIYTSSKQSH